MLKRCITVLPPRRQFEHVVAVGGMQRRHDLEFRDAALRDIGGVHLARGVGSEIAVVLGIDPQRRRLGPLAERCERRDRHVLRADELALRVGETHGAGEVDHRLQSRRLARGKRERGAAADRAAERDDPRAVGIGALDDRAQGAVEIVRLDGEILPQRRLIALCVGRVGCLAGCAVRLAVTAPDHGDREVAAVRKIAGLRRHQRAADLRHLGGQTRLAMGQERNRQPPFGGGAAHDQGLEPIASVAALDGEEGRFLDQAGVVGYRRQACRHAGCPAWRLGDRPRRR
jgi:hypothetical protein